MGTLFNQSKRDYCRVREDDVLAFLEGAKSVAKRANVELDQVLEATKILEHRRSIDIALNNADVLDEQLAGFGELILQIGNAFDLFVESKG